MNLDQIVSKIAWVSNLHPDVTIEHISELFCQVGPILYCLLDKNALVIFKHADSVSYSINIFCGTTLYGLPIKIEKYSENLEISASQKEIISHFQKLNDEYNDYHSCGVNNKSELGSRISDIFILNESVSKFSVKSSNKNRHSQNSFDKLNHSKSNSIVISNNSGDSYKRKYQNGSFSAIIAWLKNIHYDEQSLLPKEHNSMEKIFKVYDLRQIINEKRKLLNYDYKNNGNFNAPCHNDRTQDYLNESNQSYRQRRSRCDNTENSRKRYHSKIKSGDHRDNSSQRRQKRSRYDNTEYSRKRWHSSMSSSHRYNSSQRMQKRNRCDNTEYGCKRCHSQMKSSSYRDNSCQRKQKKNRCDNTEYSRKCRHSRMFSSSHRDNFSQRIQMRNRYNNTEYGCKRCRSQMKSSSHRDNSCQRKQKKNRCDNTEYSRKCRHSRMSSSHWDNFSQRIQKRNRCDNTEYGCKRCRSQMMFSSRQDNFSHGRQRGNRCDNTDYGGSHLWSKMKSNSHHGSSHYLYNQNSDYREKK